MCSSAARLLLYPPSMRSSSSRCRTAAGATCDVAGRLGERVAECVLTLREVTLAGAFTDKCAANEPAAAPLPFSPTSTPPLTCPPAPPVKPAASCCCRGCC
ncbi:unnamed protein product [Ectocarpus sp. 4 AP-2014]